MKKILILSFVILGFSSLISQVVVIRELAMSFYANEFFIGWVLFCWLLGTALGSALGSRRSHDAKSVFRSLAICHMLAAFLFPFAIILIRSGKPLLGTVGGALPEFIPSLLYSLVTLVPLCGVLGIQFAVAARAQAFQEAEGESARGVGWAYLWECLGFIAGGSAFSFVLVFANEFRVAAILAVLNLAIAAGVFHVFFRKKKRILGPLVLLAIIFPVWLFMSSGSLQQQTSQLRFPNETLLRTENTLHGNVSVTRLGPQYNFYQSGLLLGADREDLASEYLVHFPMLAHPAPQKILLLGTGFNGPLQQILKYGPQEVRAVELDPDLLKIVAGFLPQDLQSVLRDPRVRLGAADPRDFLKGENEKFDVIIANFPDPSSVLVNRNYTEQFFRSVRSHLLSEGVFATHITFSANTLTPESERLGSSVYATLSQVFPSVKVLPEDTLFFLASTEKAASLNPKEMIERLSERKIRTDFVTPDQIRYRFTNDRVERVAAAFSNAIWKTKNTDLRPRACYFEFLRWLSQFNPKIAKTFFGLATIPSPVILGVGLIAVLFLLAFSRGPQNGIRRLAQVSMGTAGFSLMAFEIVVIYLFQAAFGDLYYRLAWVITVFMVGLGLGTWAALGLKKVPERYGLLGLHFANAVFFFLLVKVCTRLFSKGFFLGEEYQFAFLGMALWAGFTAGAAFPFANRLYLSQGEGDRLGRVYAADLWGAALGALLTAGFFIPIWGVPQTLVLLGAANFLLVLLLFFRKDLSRKDL
jgi:spermidine synthase